MDTSSEQVQSESSKFRVNRELIHSVEKQDQELELQDLDITVYDHTTLEKGIIEQVKDALDEGSEEEGQSKDDPTETKDDASTSKSIVNKSNDSASFLENYLKKQTELANNRKKFVKKKTNVDSSFSLEANEIEPKIEIAPKIKVDKRSDYKRKKKTSSPHKAKRKKSMSEGGSDLEQDVVDNSSGSEYHPNQELTDDEDDICKEFKKRNAKEKVKKYQSSEEEESSWETSDDEQKYKGKSKKELDDGDLDIYIKRTKSLTPLDEKDFKFIDHQYRVPNYIWDKLFEYQRDGVRWLWSLHNECYGGVLGDEMGLGKTVQMISFLAGLHFSNEKDSEFNCHGLGPTIIVCPTTIMHQWVREFHTWYPQIRVAILHESGTFTGKNKKHLIKSISSKTKGVLITSYSGLIQNKEAILSCSWHYVILDEGHKIRNPEAQVTNVCKSFDTSHRIILSGSPMQNNLKELWSLFDFIVPGKLGSLNIFTASFVTPIVQGGYVNASKAQVLTAFKCATALRDTIKPFLLRRSKIEVDIQLPGKKEQVLFCKLTDEQREAYLAFLRSLDVNYVQFNKGRLFGALVTLRKICNHPDLYTSQFHDRYVMRDTPFGSEKGSEDDYGFWKRSGKMIVLVNLLKHWDKIGGQKVLIFTQGKKMMQVLENFIKRSGYKYLKLDGGISIAARQPLIDKFNKDGSYFIMLLTTRVGGLGVNLTGANKVVIFDPDWNPATDAQARERAWRIGQSKDVSIYRLLTTGTIEEKMYHRQIFKEFLSNKILKDPKQRRFFKSNDLMELFTLNETVSGGTSETAAIFAGTGSEIKYDPKAAAKFEMKKGPQAPKIVFSEKKLEEMRRIAQEMSKKIAKLVTSCKTNDESENKEPENKMSTDIYGPDGHLIPNSFLDNNNKKMDVDKNTNEPTNETSDNLYSFEDKDEGQNRGENSMDQTNDFSPILDDKESDDDLNYEMTFDDILNLNSTKEKSPVKFQQNISPIKLKEEESPVKIKKELSNDELIDQKYYNKIEEEKSPTKRKQELPPDKIKLDKGESSKDFKNSSKPDLKSKSRKSKKEKKRKKGDFAEFEGEVVPHLVKYKKVKKKKEEEEESFKNHDDYILHKLLKKSGVDSAMKHDAIMHDGPSDYAIVEEEASKIAEDAVKAIHQSYQQTYSPDLQSKNPLMQEIMSKLKERNLQGFSGGPQARALLSDLITFLNSNGGTASTNMLVANFREKVDSGKSAIFKKLLSSIATFYRAPDSQGYWNLKDEFKLIVL